MEVSNNLTPLIHFETLQSRHENNNIIHCSNNRSLHSLHVSLYFTTRPQICLNPPAYLFFYLTFHFLPLSSHSHTAFNPQDLKNSDSQRDSSSSSSSNHHTHNPYHHHHLLLLLPHQILLALQRISQISQISTNPPSTFSFFSLTSHHRYHNGVGNQPRHHLGERHCSPHHQRPLGCS